MYVYERRAKVAQLYASEQNCMSSGRLNLEPRPPRFKSTFLNCHGDQQISRRAVIIRLDF